MSKATTLNKYIWNITDWVRGRPWNRYMWSHKKRNGQSHVSSKSNPNHQGLDHSKQQQPAFPDVLMIESKTLYSTINHPRCLDIHKQMFLQSNTPYNLPLTSRIAKNIYDYIIVFAVHISQCVSFLIFSSTTFLDHYRKVAGKTYASRIAIIKLLCAIHKCIHWLVVYLPLWKKNQLGLLLPIYGKIKMFQTNSQIHQYILTYIYIIIYIYTYIWTCTSK